MLRDDGMPKPCGLTSATRHHQQSSRDAAAGQCEGEFSDSHRRRRAAAALVHVQTQEKDQGDEMTLPHVVWVSVARDHTAHPLARSRVKGTRADQPVGTAAS